MNEEQGFLKALKENPQDSLTRAVYADWLDDNDRPEEAMRQRMWPEADDYFRNLSEEHDIPYDDLIQGGYEGEVCQHGSSSLQDEGWSEEFKEEFWKHWEVVTGEEADEDRRGELFFRCSC